MFETIRENYLDVVKKDYGFGEVSEVGRAMAYLKENKVFSNDFIETCLDIGANSGKVAQSFYKNFTVYPDKIYLIEPDIISFEKIKILISQKKLQPFNIQNVAFSNEDKMGIFKSLSHIKLPPHLKRGDLSQISTLHDRNYLETGEPMPDGSAIEPHLYEVKVMRGDTYMKKFNLKNVDFCKIDAEGHAYEILDGFGELISNIKCIFLETESFEVWKNQKYTEDIFNFLSLKGFELALDIVRNVPWGGEKATQSNQLWINKRINDFKSTKSSD